MIDTKRNENIFGQKREKKKVFGDKNRRMIRFLGVFVFFLMVGLPVLYGQSRPDIVDSDTSDRIEIIFSESFKNIRTPRGDMRVLVGKVQMRQGDVLMRCDSAYKLGNYVRAFGNVVLQQADTLKVFADSVRYDGDVQQARLLGDVVLTDSRLKLFTDDLGYDMRTRIARYDKGGILENQETRLSSRHGTYHAATKEAFFRDEVVVVDPQFSLRADTLKVNTATNVVTFIGPTDILNKDGSQVYAVDGFYDGANKYAEFNRAPKFKTRDGYARAERMVYDGKTGFVRLDGDALVKDGAQTIAAPQIDYNTETKQYQTVGATSIADGGRRMSAAASFYDRERGEAVFVGNVRMSDSTQELTADSVRYNKSFGIGQAFGAVVYSDTANGLRMDCDTLVYNDQTGYVFGSGRPLVRLVLENDTLFLAANTLLSTRLDSAGGNDSSRLLVADGDVRIFKRDLQAVCDSLEYNSADSLFSLFKNPIIWSDTSQFSADTVQIGLRAEQIHRIWLKQNAFIVNTPDEIYFNQVKGRDMVAFFEKGELRQMRTVGNGESVYYALDAARAYLAVNKTICSEMLLAFGGNEVEHITFYTKPQSTLFPMQKVDHKSLVLKGFRWEKARRPLSVADLRVSKRAKTVRVDE